MTITIYAHRGVWSDKFEQNSLLAIQKAKNYGFGAEIDLRLQNNSVVVSHDHPTEPITPIFEDVINLKLDLALNIKTDGLLLRLEPYRQVFQGHKSFLFDGSIPEMYKVAQMGIPHALRLSEYEKELPWSSQYIWCDAFEDEWWIKDSRLLDYLHEGKKIVFVSPELHGRKNHQSWKQFKLWKLADLKFGVCTDQPAQLDWFLNHD
jgi:hypothetical protein